VNVLDSTLSSFGLHTLQFRNQNFRWTPLLNKPSTYIVCDKTAIKFNHLINNINGSLSIQLAVSSLNQCRVVVIIMFVRRKKTLTGEYVFYFVIYI